MRTLRLGSTLRVTFQVLVVLTLLGAIGGALLVLLAPDLHVVFGDDLVQGASAVGVGALCGATVVLVMALLAAFLIALFGVVVPTVIVAALLFAALAVVVVAVAALGSVAVALAPFLLVGFGCVLLMRALLRRPRREGANA